MEGVKQSLTLVIAWLHGCIGLHFWLRLKARYASWVPVAYAGALLIPVVSLLGFVVAGREVVRLAQDPAWLRAAKIEINFADAQGAALVGHLETAILMALAGLFGLTLVARWVRLWVEWKRHRVHVVYPDGRRVTVVPGATILETSRAAGIPHASVCGGRGRCSTCRVRAHQGLELLPPPSAEERRVLARVGAPPNVRLACQTRPVADVAVTPLLSPDATPSQALPAPGYLQGDEREVAIFSLQTCVASPPSPRINCPMTSSSCSTSISAPWAERWKKRADGLINLSETVSWRCSVLIAASRRAPGEP
jgi:adenylate cyclase